MSIRVATIGMSPSIVITAQAIVAMQSIEETLEPAEPSTGVTVTPTTHLRDIYMLTCSSSDFPAVPDKVELRELGRRGPKPKLPFYAGIKHQKHRR